MNYLEAARKVIEIEKEALQRVAEQLSESFEQAVKLLHSSLNEGGKIVIIGVGKSGNIGNKITATFNSTGATAVLLNAQDALHGDLGILSKGDVAIAMSYSGETPEMLNLIPYIRKQEVDIIALTSKPQSRLGKLATHVLDSSVGQEACPLNLAPTSSSTAMLALGDALAMVLLEARGFTKDDFAQFHPGGSIGKVLLTTVNDIMRSGEDIPSVSPGATVLESLKAMSDKKAGICLIIGNGKLHGVLTHGDFVRLYTSDHNAGSLDIAEVMTQNPITLTEGQLAAEAINILKQHRIDDLVIVNESGTPIGIIDSQDLARNQLL